MFLIAFALADEAAFDRPLAVASYGSVRSGAYNAGGLGGRLRLEPTKNFGLDLYLEMQLVDWPGGFRHDYPNGFSLYAAIPIGPARIRTYAGICDIVSLVEPTQPGAPRADDVLLGAHAGIGSEWALNPALSLFIDGQVELYAGHDRASGNWTGNVAEDLRPFFTTQVNAGVQVHIPDLL